MDPRLRTIRFWLYAAVLVAGVVLSQAWYMLAIAPMLFMPVFGTTSCVIYSDDFSTNTISSYTQDAGSWSISSGIVSVNSNNARLRLNSTSPTGHGRVRVRFRFVSASSTINLIGSYVDANNYLFLEVTSGGNLKLWDRTSGSNTQIGSAISVGSLSTFTFYDIEICWDGTTAKGLFYGTVSAGFYTAQSISGSYSGTGSGAALGTGTVASTVSFDNLVFEKHQTDDATCTVCGGAVATCGSNLVTCSGGIFPPRISASITFSGSGDCYSTCSSVGIGTFILSNVAAADSVNSPANGWPCAGLPSTASQCFFAWSLLLSDTILGSPCVSGGTGINNRQVYVEVTKFTDGFRVLGALYFADSTGGPGAAFSYLWFASAVLDTNPLDCMDVLDGLVLNQVCRTSNAGALPNVCNITNATMTLGLP